MFNFPSVVEPDEETGPEALRLLPKNAQHRLPIACERHHWPRDSASPGPNPKLHLQLPSGLGHPGSFPNPTAMPFGFHPKLLLHLWSSTHVWGLLRPQSFPVSYFLSWVSLDASRRAVPLQRARIACQLSLLCGCTKPVVRPPLPTILELLARLLSCCSPSLRVIMLPCFTLHHAPFFI